MPKQRVEKFVRDLAAAKPLFAESIVPAADKVGPRGSLSHAGYLERLEKASVANTLDNLMTFPRLRKLTERGAVTLHGAYFGVAAGELSVLDRATGEFYPVKAPP